MRDTTCFFSHTVACGLPLNESFLAANGIKRELPPRMRGREGRMEIRFSPQPLYGTSLGDDTSFDVLCVVRSTTFQANPTNRIKRIVCQVTSSSHQR